MLRGLQVQGKQQGGVCSGGQWHAAEDRGPWSVVEEGQVHRRRGWQPVCSEVHAWRRRLHPGERRHPAALHCMSAISLKMGYS